MQRYEYCRDSGMITKDGMDFRVPDLWPLYSAADVDAELAAIETNRHDSSADEITRLKAEVESVRIGAGLIQVASIAEERRIKQLDAEVELHKAALRWAVEQGSLRLDTDTNTIYDTESGRDAAVPPEFAPLIAEAVKP